MAQFGLEHWLWEPGVVGSNPTAPTKRNFANCLGEGQRNPDCFLPYSFSPNPDESGFVNAQTLAEVVPVKKYR